MTNAGVMGNTLLGIVIGLIMITVLFNLVSPTFHNKYMRKRVGNEKRMLTKKEATAEAQAEAAATQSENEEQQETNQTNNLKGE